MTIPNQTPHVPPAEPWRSHFKKELDKLESSYWVIKQPINPKEYAKVVTDIHLQCQEIFNHLGDLDTENTAHLLNYIFDKNQQSIRRIEQLQGAASNKESYDSGIKSLRNLDKRLTDVALNLAVAQEEASNEEASNSLVGRVSRAAQFGLDLFMALSMATPIVIESTLKMTDDIFTVGVNHLASQYLPTIARSYAPDQLLQGRYSDMRSFAMAVLSKVTQKKVSSLPLIGDSRKVHRAVEKSTRKVTGFEDKFFAPLQQKLLTLMAPGNFQQMLSRALIATAFCIELIQEAEKLPGDIALRKEFLTRRLHPGASAENYAKSMKREREALTKRFLGGSEELNPASKVIQELLVRFSKFSGLTNLVIATTVETLTQTPQPAKLPDPQLGQTLAEMHQKMQRDYPIAAELLQASGGWAKMRALEHYADIASAYIQNQLLDKAVILVSPNQQSKSQATHLASFNTAMHQLIDSIHAITTSDKTWDQYWLRLFTSLPKQQILKRVDWNSTLAEPLRVQWHQWVAGK